MALRSHTPLNSGFFLAIWLASLASYDELKDLGGWKSSNMVDRYAKFATENLAFAASRIKTEKDRKVIKDAKQSYKPANFELIGSPKRTNLVTGLLRF